MQSFLQGVRAGRSDSEPSRALSCLPPAPSGVCAGHPGKAGHSLSLTQCFLTHVTGCGHRARVLKALDWWESGSSLNAEGHSSHSNGKGADGVAFGGTVGISGDRHTWVGT